VLITLATDFGLKDPFAGIMKGVILEINPEASIVDITHKISRHNIVEASQVTSISYKYFPKGTIHVVVVDPGVGSERRPILVSADGHYFIGPDNGIFTSLYEKEPKVIYLTNKDYFLPSVGSTFHGRDIYAPVAAHLSTGLDISGFGTEIRDYVKLALPKPGVFDDSIKGEIVTIDNFGNAISNITGDDIAKIAGKNKKEGLKVMCKDIDISVVGYYAESVNLPIAALINSFGFLEIFSYRKSVADNFNIRTGDGVKAALR
jgi:S-adenosylmethionine hydrolase